MPIKETLQEWARDRGYRFATAPVSLLNDVRRSLEQRRNSGEIDPDFFRGNLAFFKYLDGTAMGNPVSIILIAVPRPAHVLTFSIAGKTTEMLLPPTYVNYQKMFEDVRDDLSGALAAYGCRLEVLSAPLKALGNRMGFLKHGRNNIGYVKDLGSYLQLVGLISEKPVHDEDFSPRVGEALLDRCGECRICTKACPTQAIDLQRVLIRAEKCYTLFSESMNPIPEGLWPPSPQCLIGCLRCQDVCPENKGLLRYAKTAVSFTALETESFLNLAPGSERGIDVAREKFRDLGLSADVLLYARNLRHSEKLAV